jgi:ATP-dependent helicase Lhr and Lhr-like helicase
VLGPPLTEAEGAARQARLLLDRYGVVSRESLEREHLRWDWAQLYHVFQQLELRGEVRRGYFVEGLSGAQFARPEAVEALRRPPVADEPVVVLAAADPAQLFGGEYAAVQTPRFARVPSTHVAFAAGVPIVVFEDHGARISTRPDAPTAQLQRALLAYVQRPYGSRRITVETWNGRPVFASEGQPLLQATGFKNTPGGMEWWASP